MDLASRFRVAAVTGEILPIATTEDPLVQLFLLFCNEGRRDKVVLGLTDTMYKKRLSTAGELNSMAKGGFKNLLRQANALPQGVDVDFIFMQHLGYTDPKSPKFELQFDHFLDACQAVACALYPNDSANGALRALFTNHLAPLAHAHFGSDIIDAHAAGDAGSVVSGGTSRPGSARVTGLCLTPKGTLSLAAVGEGTPSVPMLVTTAPHVGPVPGSSVPLANPGGTTLPRRTMSVRLASGAATPDNGSVVSGMGGSATASRRPISSGFYPPLSSPLGQPNFAGTGGAPSVQLRSPPPAYAGTTGGLGSPSLRHGIASPLARFSFTGASLGATAAGGEPAAPPSAPSPSIGVTAAQLEALLGQLQLQAAQLAAEKARNASLEARLSALEQSAPAPAQQPSAPSEPSATPAAAAVAETGSQ